MRVAVIDNYDSFTYNLVQYLEELGARALVHRNDARSPGDILALAPDAILISPGPGEPQAAGISCALIACAAGRVPILGVCLGHQCLGLVYGARIVRAAHIMHGKTAPIFHDGQGLFAGLPNPFPATRYHSLLVDPATVPADLEIRARTADNEIMAMKHRAHETWGVQFHPESILTAGGKRLLANFLALAARAEPRAGGAAPIKRNDSADEHETR
jgi:anthranilate synthase/aminodeoxychorismate synthase-like glutamine amidotransferase